MKSNRLFLRRRTRGLLFATLLFLLSSCTIGYHEDESFESDVKNATLESPQLENVKVELDATGENATIEWPVVHGAEGYEFSWYVVDDPENPIAVVEGEFIDGCSVELEVEEDTKYKFLIKQLVKRDFKVRYKRSVLGVFWSFLNPLLMMIVQYVVFSQLFKSDIENYPVYLLSGQLIFIFYSEVTTCSMSAIIDNGPLIKKVYVPKYLFILARTFSSTINLLASFTALIVVMLAMRVELHYTVLLVWIPLAFIVAFSLGVGLLLSAIAVKFRDIMHLYSVFVTALMYLTPVIYPMSILPEWLKPIVLLNPLTNILQMFRGVMMYNSLPGIKSILIAAVECVVMLVIGLYVFYKRQDSFILDI